MTKDFDTALDSYLLHIKSDYCGWNVDQTEVAARMRDEFFNSVRVDKGSKYLKVVTRTSVHSFIVLKADAKFKVGDILKAASWRAPATNFSRGNILEGDFGRIRWTGAI